MEELHISEDDLKRNEAIRNALSDLSLQPERIMNNDIVITVDARGTDTRQEISVADDGTEVRKDIDTDPDEGSVGVLV